MTRGLKAAGLPVLLFLTSPLQAQRFDIGLTAPQCEAIVSNALSNPARTDTLHLVRHCPGQFGPVMSELLRRSDLPATDWPLYKHIITFAVSFREADVFDAALALAVDTSSAYLGRVGALFLIHMYTSGKESVNTDRYLDLFIGSGEGRTGCGGTYSWPPTTWPGEVDLPTSAKEQALSAAREVLASASEAGLSVLASCIRDDLDRTGAGWSVPTEFTPSTDFSWVRQCGRRFLLRNSSRAWVSMERSLLAMTVPPTLHYTRWSFPPRPEGAAYSEETWIAPGAGTASIRQIPPVSPYLMPPTEVDVTPC